MNKHTAITPDGKTIKRNSQNRTYTHAVVALHTVIATGEKVWLAVGWCGRPDLAAKLASQGPGRVIVEAVVA